MDCKMGAPLFTTLQKSLLPLLARVPASPTMVLCVSWRGRNIVCSSLLGLYIIVVHLTTARSNDTSPFVSYISLLESSEVEFAAEGGGETPRINLYCRSWS
jgi:hypothetical protein